VRGGAALNAESIAVRGNKSRDLDSPVFCPAFASAVVGDRFRFASSFCPHAGSIANRAPKHVLNDSRPRLRQMPVGWKLY